MPAPVSPYSFSSIHALGLELSHRDHFPCLQYQHSPHAIGKGTMTRSPGFRLRDLVADLDDLSHEFVAQDVALLHGRDVAVIKMQVGTADPGQGDLHDGVLGIAYLRIGDVIHPDIMLAMPAYCLHIPSFRAASRGAR